MSLEFTLESQETTTWTNTSETFATDPHELHSLYLIERPHRCLCVSERVTRSKPLIYYCEHLKGHPQWQLFQHKVTQHLDCEWACLPVGAWLLVQSQLSIDWQYSGQHWQMGSQSVDQEQIDQRQSQGQELPRLWIIFSSEQKKVLKIHYYCIAW